MIALPMDLICILWFVGMGLLVVLSWQKFRKHKNKR